MADIQSTLRYDADLGSAMAQVKTLTGQINTLNLAFNSLDASAQKTKMSMANAFSSNVGSMGAYTSKIVQMKSAAESFGEAIQKNRLTMSQYFKEAAVGLVKQDSLLKQYARQQVRYQQSISMSMGTGVGGKPMAMVLTPKALDMANAATRMKVLNQEFNTFRTLVNQGATELINFGKNTQWTGRQLTVGLTMPVVLFGAAFAKTFMKIDKELTRFAKVYGQDLVSNNAAATEKMKQQVMDLAKTISSTMGVAASETAALAADVAATGKTGQDLLDTVAQTTRLAVLGEVDRQEAMKATLAIQTAFKQNTSELADSINFLNAVENQTSTTLNDLVEAIPKAGPVIKGLGGSIKDLSVLMVAMKEGGIPAAEAANAIKSGMASLINPTKKASETARQFGVDIEGIVKTNKGQLMPTIFALQGALNGLDDFSKSRVIEEIFGKYQFARISALFNNLGKAGSQTQEAMKLAGASTVELAAVASRELRTYTESTTVRFQRMVETIKNQLVPIGQALLDGLMPILNAASGIIDTVGRFFEKIPDQGKGFLKFAGAIALLAGPALMLIGLFKQLIGNGVKAAMSIVTLGARLAGIKVGPLQHLDAEAAAAQAQVQNLTTSFVSQSEAVGMLNAEMQLYLQGLRRLAGASPQMFTPPIGGRPTTRPPIRRAGGGDVPGGYGGGDSVPALLESGEFVVRKEAASKYRPILDAMNSGTIKGLVLGTKKQSPLHAAHTQTAFDPRSNQYIYGMELIAEKFGLTTKQLERFTNKFPDAIKILGKSVATLPDNINYALKGTGALSENFRAGFDKTKGMAYLPTALQGGFNVQEEGAVEAVKQFTNRVKERAIAIADATNKGLVTDGILDKAQREVIKEIHQTAASQDPVQKSSKKLALIIDQQAGRLGEARIAVNQKQIRDNPKDFVVKGNTTYYVDRSSGQMIPVSEVGPTGRRRQTTVKYSAADSAGGTAEGGGPRIPLYTPALGRTVTQGTGSGYLNAPQGLKLVEKEIEVTTNKTVKTLLNAFVVAFRKAQRSGSPAEEYADRMKVEGKNASDGSVKGFRTGLSGVDEGMGQAAQQAGRSSLDKIRMQMKNLGPTPATGDSSPYTPAPQGPGVMGASIMMAAARKQGIAGATGRFTDFTPEQLKMIAAQRRVEAGYGRETDAALLGRSNTGGVDSEQTGPRRSLSQGLMNKSSAMMNIGFMGSMVAGMMSMNGEVNAATTALTALTTATMAAGSAMQMMSMFSGGGGKGFMGLKGLGGAMESKGASMIAAGGARAGVGSLLANLGPKVAMAGGPYGIAAAAAVTALVGGFILYKKAAGEARERANAAFAEPTKLAEYFGKTLKDVNATLKDIAVSGASDEIGAIDQGLRDVVSQDYATLIEKLKTSITSIGAADLGNAYTQMIIEGMSADEATAAIKAVASEAGTAGGLAFDQAMGKSLLSSKNVEEAFGQRMAAIDPNSQYNQKRTAELMAQRADIQANPVGMTRYGKGYTNEQMDQLSSINESLNVSGEVFSSTLKDAIKLSQSSPEIVAKYAKDIAASFKQLNASSMSFAGLGQSEQEVAFDQFKNMMGELNDPAINKAVDSLQRATPEIQGLAMEVVALGIPLTEATDQSGRFSETLANGAIASKRAIIALNEEIKILNDEFNKSGGRGMRATIEAANKEYEKLLNKRQGFEKTTKYQIGLINQELNQSRKKSESAVEGMQSEIDVLDEKIKLREEENDIVVKSLEKEKQQIQDTTDKYLSSIKKRQEADTFYANQRKSNIGALGKLASGDVFGFLQDRQAIAQEGDSFAYDQQIKAIEERRDAEVSSIDKTIEKKNEQTDKFVNAQQKQIDMVQKQIDTEQKAMDQREENTQKTIRQYEKIRKAEGTELDKQITKLGGIQDRRKNINEGIKNNQIQSFEAVTEAYNKSIGDQYKIFALDIMKKTFIRMKEEKATVSELQGYLSSEYRKLFPETNVIRNSGVTTEQIAKEVGVTFSANGGYISGPGGPTEDKIPAMLSNGEYVIRASSVEKYGPDLMDSINMGYYAEGGLIEQRRGAGGSGGPNARFVSQLQLLKDSKRNPKNKPTNTTGATTTNTDGEAAVNYAKQQFGDPYDLNPSPPNSWGCSVLTAWAYNRGTKNGQNRYNFETYSESQANTISGKIMRPSGTPGDGSAPQIPYNRFKVGDLVYFSNTGLGPSGRHIGLYSGNGQMVHAGNPVGYSDLNSDWNRKYFTYGGTPKPKFAKGGMVGNAKAGMFGMGGMAKTMPRYAVGGNIVMPSGPSTNISAPTYNIAINANGIQDPAYFANKVIGIIKKEQKRVDHSRSVFS